MAAVSGRSFLLKTGTGTVVTVAALRTTSFTVDGSTVDITNKDSAGMQELLSAGGVAKIGISAGGVLTGAAQSTDLIAKALARTLDPYTIVFDNGDKIEGSFQLTSFGASGDYNGEQTYTLSLESSGTMTLTPAS